MGEYRYRILLISNLYPSVDHPTYGIFVSKFERAIETQNFVISSRAVISGKGRTFISKVAKYSLFYFSIVCKVLKGKYDILFIHYISNSAPILFFLWKFIRRPVVINFHGGDLLRITGMERYTEKITKFFVERANLLVVPSEYFKEEVSKRYNIKEEDVYVYPSGGVDLSIFKLLGRNTLRSKVELSDSFVIGFVGRIDKGKRWDIFLDAINLFRKSHPGINYKAIVVGNGLEITSFHLHASKLKLEDTLLFFGERDHQSLPEIYNLMDIFVFATDNESLGLVGLEAMACGVPIIAPLVGGIKSYLQDGVNGFCLESLNEQSIVNTLNKFYELNTHAKDEMKEKAVLTAKRFDDKKVTEGLAEKLESILIK